LGIRVYLSSTGWSAISIELGGEEERLWIGQKSYLEHASEHGHRVERTANGGGDRHHRRTSRASARRWRSGDASSVRGRPEEGS
jgi:hypothetical protein